MTTTAAPATHALDPVLMQKMAVLEGLARTYIAKQAARSKRADAELIRVATGSRADLGGDIANAAGALVAARTGALADWSDADVARAAETLAALNAQPAA